MSLAAAEHPPELRRVFVVENGTVGEAKSTCEALSRKLPVEYHCMAQAGKSRALQWAVEQIEIGLVVFFDDDIRVSPGILCHYVAAAQRQGVNSVYGGPVGVDYEAPPEDWLIEFLPVSAVGWEPESPDEISLRKRGGFLGTNYAVFAETILEGGGFNLSVGPGALTAGTEGNPTGQEEELQRRLFARGVRPVYVRDAKVWHYVPKERCGTQWALHRIYRFHFSKQLVSGDAKQSSPHHFGVPRWMFRKLCESYLLAKLAFIVPSRRRRFLLRRRFYRILGAATGYRAAHSRRGVIDQPPAARARGDP